MTTNEYEKLISTLVNHTIMRVVYYEVFSEDSEEYWNNNEFDSLDFGLDLHTKSGECFGIMWGSEFYQYGVSILNHSLKEELSAYKSFDVSRKSNWNSYIDKSITDTKIIRSWLIETDSLNKTYYPQDLILTFENNKSVYISALQILDEKNIHYMTDNITVIFDKEGANKYNIGNSSYS